MKKIVLSALILLMTNANAQTTGNAAMEASDASTKTAWVFTTIGLAMIGGGLVSLFVGSANGSNVTSHFH